ncbi:MAG: hypothetical protein AB7U05_06075 [Mangrovibacterium sp.]
MEKNKVNKDKILEAIGLKRHLVWKETNTSIYDKTQFLTYVPVGYKNSPLRELDESYRMFELVLLHKITGLRVTYITSENYFGDQVDYNMKDLFVITNSGKRFDVIGVDFHKQVFLTPNMQIRFEDISKRQ